MKNDFTRGFSMAAGATVFAVLVALLLAWFFPKGEEQEQEQEIQALSGGCSGA